MTFRFSLPKKFLQFLVSKIWSMLLSKVMCTLKNFELVFAKMFLEKKNNQTRIRYKFEVPKT